MCVVDNKLYFTNWLTKDIKVLDLYNYTISSFSTLPNVPEDIVTDGNYLYVSTPHQELYDSQGSSVMKIDITDGNIVDTYEVGLGPEQLYLDGNLLHVSRTSYDENWLASFGSSKVDITSGNVEIVTYGVGTACRADIFKMNKSLFDDKIISGDIFITIDNETKNFTEIIGACERIKKTPIPYSYNIFLKKFIFVYTLTLPFGLTASLFYYWTVPICVFILYILASLELLAEEIENPFGNDPNDLPVDDICDDIKKNVSEILLNQN